MPRRIVNSKAVHQLPLKEQIQQRVNNMMQEFDKLSDTRIEQEIAQTFEGLEEYYSGQENTAPKRSVQPLNSKTRRREQNRIAAGNTRACRRIMLLQLVQQNRAFKNLMSDTAADANAKDQPSSPTADLQALPAPTHAQNSGLPAMSAPQSISPGATESASTIDSPTIQNNTELEALKLQIASLQAQATQLTNDYHQLLAQQQPHNIDFLDLPSPTYLVQKPLSPLSPYSPLAPSDEQNNPAVNTVLSPQMTA